MLAAFVVACLLFVSSGRASPVSNPQAEALSLPSFDPRGLLCQLPVIRSIPALCPRQGGSGTNINTPIGTAKGTVGVSGAVRFAAKYGSAQRWKASSVATTWALPNGASDPTALPLACPQPNADDASFTEDCLSVLLYVPSTLKVGSAVPTLMWIHGGSFIVGSATNPGLDGSKLAIATNSIVAVVQYRLGALGWMAPDGTTNLALKDIVTAMTFLKKVLPSFGGDSSKITLAGQSSGANMIRALLAVPSASLLFQSAIIQSDPMDYGFLSSATQSKLQASFTSSLNCTASSTSCLNALSLDNILDAQSTLFSNAINIDASAGNAEPIRPVHDGSFITSPLDSTAPFPSQSKPLLISTVLDEAAPSIFGAFSSALPEAAFGPVVNATFGTTRTQTIVSSANYAAPSSASGNSSAADDDARLQLTTLGTDYLWKCSSWTFARNWVGSGGKAYVGLYVVGATYPGNDEVSFCTESGHVCHQDDIEIIFGTVPSPTSAQSQLTAAMQARYSAFLRTGSPNTGSVAAWTPATTSDVHALSLGGSGEAPVGACSPDFWGKEVLYDYQVYDI